MKQLERLMYLQGGDCFFCGKPIPDGEASVEHLVATANGGQKSDDNCVACCKSLNTLLGSRTIKEKLQIVLNQKGPFRCPANIGKPGSETALPPDPLDGKVALVMEDLRKRGSSRPLKPDTLRNTIAAVFGKQFTEEEINAILERLQANGCVSVQDGKITYKLPPKKKKT
jgi:hypothetical protein